MLRKTETIGFGTAITKKMLARSGFMALFLTIVGLGLQVARTRFFLHGGPPRLGRIAGLTICYLVMAFAYALGFFLIEKKIPGRSQAGKGLFYSALVIFSVWIGGFIGMFAIDFDGLRDPLSSVKINIYWTAAIDILNLAIGELVLGRIALASLALPILCAGIFWIIAAALPSGYDLSGERAPAFYLFLFGPCALTGAGAAPFHDWLRSGERGGSLSEPLKISLFVYLMYWLTNTASVPFFGFTWQVTANFLIAAALSLLVSIVALEKIARRPIKAGRDELNFPRRRRLP